MSLAPRKGEVEEAFGELFPSLLGVNISFYLPEEVAKTVHEYVQEHREMPTSRIKAAIRELSDELEQHQDSNPKGLTEIFLSHISEDEPPEN